MSVCVRLYECMCETLPPCQQGEELYVYPPHGYGTDREVIWKLAKPLYGLAVAPRRWAETLKTWLRDYGFKSVNCSETFYTWTSPVDPRDNIHLVFHVDDILFSFNSDQVGLNFKSALLSRFVGTDDGPVKTFVGITVTRDGDSTCRSLRGTHV
jgi:Reverse transcriptase (RNA-dependent DNA polymerase)